MNYEKVKIIFNNNDEKVLVQGDYNVKNISKINVKPYCNVQIFEDENGKGNQINLNTNLNEKEIDVEKLKSSGIISNVKSLKVLNKNNIEGFVEVKDSCHFICSSLNFKNIIICLAFIYLINELLKKN